MFIVNLEYSQTLGDIQEILISVFGALLIYIIYIVVYLVVYFVQYFQCFPILNRTENMFTQNSLIMAAQEKLLGVINKHKKHD